jgi:coenzyme F420-reducing hydrogenase beta subunit
MTEYLLSKDLTKCCGCSACEQICPKNAIELKQNEEGFLYPILEEGLCVKCGICNTVCPYGNEIELIQPKNVFAAQYQAQNALKKSSSGGMFSAFADYVIQNDGVVAGCIFDEYFKSVHVVTEHKELVEKMRGSKYVQTDMADTFKKTKECLEAERIVLFTGTPCQIDGLKRFLKKDYKNLYTVDLICHGVPSPLLLEKYLEQIKKERGTVTDLKFRNKERNGWCSQGSLSYFAKNKEKTVTITPFKDSYYNLYYLENCVSRLSCYSCQYATEKRVGDITIGDYWNIDDRLNLKDFKDGMSVVLINTEKGRILFDEVRSKLNVYESDLEHAVKGNGNLKNPGKMPLSRNQIYKKIKENGYAQTTKEECKFSYILPFIRKHIPKSFKVILKKFI